MDYDACCTGIAFHDLWIEVSDAVGFDWRFDEHSVECEMWSVVGRLRHCAWSVTGSASLCRHRREVLEGM